MKNIKKRVNEGITFMVIPHSSGKLYKVRISHRFLYFILFLFLSCLILGASAYYNKNILLLKKEKIYEKTSGWNNLFLLLSNRKKDIQDHFIDFNKYGNLFYRTIWENYSEGIDSFSTAEHKNLLNEYSSMNHNFHLGTESLLRTLKFLTLQEDMLQNLPLGWPIKSGFITSTYGYRKSPFGATKEFHAGYDFANVIGTPIIATAPGKIVFAGDNNSGYGMHVKILHRFGFLTLYAHGSALKVEVDQYVERGHVIMLLGRSGSATGPHLHYEIRLQNGDTSYPFGINLNPVYFIRINE